MLRTTFLRTPRQLMHEAEKKEQGLFDSNKKRLDTLEHGKNPDYKQPGMEDLKKKGDDARIEQNRPDDGVY
ncbi:unnamed protein product [Saccharomyces cerevisiae]|nr:unnamed protein product [Saccharomyces cerevisiae]